MGLRDDAEEVERIGGQWDWFNREGACCRWHETGGDLTLSCGGDTARGVPEVWTPEYCAMSECSRRMAQMIGRARAEARAAQDAVTDHASEYFVLQQINRILEALQ